MSHTTLMMAAGGGSGLLLLTVGVIGSVKSRQSAAVDTQNGKVYGPEAWREFGKSLNCTLKIVGEVPPAPEEPVAKGMIRLYIPEQVRVNGKVKDFNLNTLAEIAKGSFNHFNREVKDQFGQGTASGWIDINRTLMEGSRSQTYVAQMKMVEDRGNGYRMLHVLEAIVLNLMVFAFTEERLFGVDPLTFTRCEELINDQYPVVVGRFNTSGLYVGYNFCDGSNSFGVAAVRDFTNS